MTFRRMLAAAMTLMLVLAACGDANGDGDNGESGGHQTEETDPDGDGGGLAGDGGGLASGGGALAGDASHIDVERVGHLTSDDVGALSTSVNDFGFALHRGLTADGGNVVTSPLSVSMLLAMVAAGADGATAEEMAAVLRIDDVRDARFGALLRQVAHTDDVTLTVANALWANEGVVLEDDYADHVRGVFGATLDEVALGEPASAELIDAWVQDRTAGLIDGIADDLGLPNPEVVLVLANAVHFRGEWTVQFDVDHTVERDFTLADGTVVPVPTMHRHLQADEEVELAVRDGYRMLRLPYGDDERYAMEILLPDPEADLPSLVERLSAEEWTAAVSGLAPLRGIEVALPRLELEWDAELNDVLTALGMPTAFGPGADFRAMSPEAPFLGTVVHKTFIRVDEEGTEAAAVTGADMPTSAPATAFVVDRPFAFTVSDADTGTVLFLGTVEDPRG